MNVSRRGRGVRRTRGTVRNGGCVSRFLAGGALALLAASASIGHAQAQAGAPPARAGSIHGRVLAAGTKAPLRNARINVTLGAQSIGTVFTDDEGRFIVPSLGDGSYGIAASKSGYITSNFGSLRPGEPGRSVTAAEREILEGSSCICRRPPPFPAASLMISGIR